MQFENPYIVYIKINEFNYITAINSSEFLNDITDWIIIDKGFGDKYHHAQGNYFPKPIFTDEGAYQYKFINNIVIECTEEEIATQVLQITTQPQPTQLDVIESKVSYMAMMTGLTEII